MKLKTLGLVALVATLGLASCKKEEGPAVVNGPKAVSIKLTNVVPPTRGADLAIADGTQVTLNSFQVFFTDGTTLYEGKVLGTGDNADVAANPLAYAEHYFSAVTTAEYYDDLKNVGVFHFLPANVDKVIVIGNIGADTENKGFDVTSGTTTLAQLKTAISETVSINAQQNDANLVLYDEVDLTTVVGNDTNGHPMYKADLTLEPLVSRFEITGFEYALKDGATEREYTSLSIEQIFFNNFYQTANKFTGVPATLYTKTINSQTVFTVFEDEQKAEEAVTADADKGIEAKDAQDNWWNDMLGVTESTSLAKVSLAAQTWESNYAADANRPTYHFFPSASEYPQIVIKLIGTKGTGATATTHPLYLATNRFVTTATTDANNPSPNMVDGAIAKIYLVDFVFDDDDLKDPEKCVDVNVKVVSWDTVSVIPEF